MINFIKTAIRRARARKLAETARQKIFCDALVGNYDEMQRDRLERYWFRMDNIACGFPPFTPRF